MTFRIGIISDTHGLLRPEAERRLLLGRDIAFIPQNPMTALNPVVRIEPQVTDVLRMHLGFDFRLMISSFASKS